ncbi:hypothetical protein [Corynebacterium lowii]|nr:hypothetical protein [Corynebacterium lowii]MDP9852108.1 hypothetical protein [Corynebacterium lowii]
MTAPHARLVGGAITLDKARVRVAEADPGEIWVDLLNHDDEGAFVEFDSLYDHLVRSTPWDMWTGYDDVPALCKSTGIAMKHRPLLARAS